MKPLQEEIETLKGGSCGLTAWILGSGPSLDDMVDEPGHNVDCFALNLTVLMRKWKRCSWISRDGRALKQCRDKIRKDGNKQQINLLFTDFAGTIRAYDLGFKQDELFQVFDTRKLFYTTETVLVYALQVVDYLGYDEIILSGVDLCDPGGKTYAKEIDWKLKGHLGARFHRFKRQRVQVAEVISTMRAKVRTTSPGLDGVIEHA